MSIVVLWGMGVAFGGPRTTGRREGMEPFRLGWG